MNDRLLHREANADNDITLGSMIMLLLVRFHWLLLAGLSCGLAVFFITSYLLTATYESRVSFYVYNSSDSALSTGTINNNDLQAAESLATTYSKILVSNSVLDAILEDLEDDRGITRKDLSRMTKAAVVDDTQLLEVIITSPDPQFACDVANSFVNVVPTEIVRITKAGGVEVVDRPELATEKSSPRTLFDTVIGVLIGIVVSAIIILARAVSDRTIYLPEDIQNHYSVTILGQIPRIEYSDKTKSDWSLMKGGEFRFADDKEETPET